MTLQWDNKLNGVYVDTMMEVFTYVVGKPQTRRLQNIETLLLGTHIARPSRERISVHLEC